MNYGDYQLPAAAAAAAELFISMQAARRASVEMEVGTFNASREMRQPARVSQPAGVPPPPYNAMME